ncbi:MAG: RecBCD enzyme subunit RecD [Verrucomicrobiota bacterium]|jgi:exodeoxyribonuclease V alpha subunit
MLSFNTLDRRFAELAVSLQPSPSPGMAHYCRLVSALARDGHSCLDLARLAELRWKDSDEEEDPGSDSHPVFVPEDYSQHPLLALHGGKLQLSHLRDKESLVRRRLLQLASDSLECRPESLDALDLLFPASVFRKIDGSDTGLLNYQKVAAYAAIRSRLTVITGGPGTGKTTTVRQLVKVLQEQNPGLRVLLAAPTGKAVNRLSQSLHGDGFKIRTLHRLLEYHHGSGDFRRNASRPLAADLVIIDEVSMVGLELFASLLSALPASCRLVLLGDKDQLAAVETGSVLADLCAHAAPLNRFSDAFRAAYPQSWRLAPSPDSHPLRDHVVVLEYTYRNESAPELARAAAAINSGQLPELPRQSPEDWLESRRADFRPRTGSFDADEVGRLLASARILAAVNQGALGVSSLNQLACQKLFRQSTEQNFAGKQIIITANSYENALFNGDTGVLLPDSSGELRAWFPDPASPDGLRHFAPAFLPPHQCAFAISIHKSQGSEYRDILCVLPHRDNPVLTRSLVYTAVTRAQQKASLFDPSQLLRQAVARVNQPHTGLFA